MTQSAFEALSTGRVTVDLAALTANYRAIAARCAPAVTGAVVKADAYGLGSARVVSTLAKAGCRNFFVAHLSEASPLGEAVAGGALYILNGLAPGQEEAAVAMGVIPVLNGPEQVRAWAAVGAELGRRLPAAIQVDSGMARLGLTADEVETLANDPDLLAALDVRLVMSHLASGDEPGSHLNDDQRARFLSLAARLPGARLSLANSGGAFLASGFDLDLVRPGIALYGGAAHMGGEPLSTVVTLDAPVVQLRDVPAGTGIGYGHMLTSEAPMRLATVSLGYADGWPRGLSGRGAAWFGDVRLPFAGRVSMDSIILDVTGLPRGALKVGDRVEFLGPNRPLDVVAEEADTITHEILARLGPRLARVYTGDVQ